MITVSVFYPQGEGKKFDPEYYLKRHMPMIKERLGAALKGVSVEQGLGGMDPGSKPVYTAMCHMMFDSVEAFQSAFGPHAQSIMADVQNYTNIQPLIQISEIKI